MSSPDSGILLLDKPQGLSSNAALGRAKRVLGLRKAGHTGTLDPMASGLLVLCFGEATKVAGFLLDGDKTYLAEIFLGATTDTDDAEGEVIEHRPVPSMSSAVIEGALDGFRGEIQQAPPMYSALKHHGQRLYALARRGESVERPARPVTIHELLLLDTQPDRMTVQVRCSKGTYIRSLARDLGEKLGCGAHLSALRRTQSGPFALSDAVRLAELDTMDAAAAKACLKPADCALTHLPSVDLDADDSQRLQLGQKLPSDRAGSIDGLVRLYGPDGFFGLGEAEARGLKPKRLFRTSGR
ncbi:MAG: tRNA pseudouridine(55) synthase TruB [Wenzhouxiangella sp.]|nr:tRNA pseudouridine(55) synthase TruB [Wenzhouxiangella sp.]